MSDHRWYDDPAERGRRAAAQAAACRAEQDRLTAERTRRDQANEAWIKSFFATRWRRRPGEIDPAGALDTKGRR